MRIAIRVSTVIFCFVAALACGCLPAAAQNGAIEFAVRVRPASGIAKPARGMPFCLLKQELSGYSARGGERRSSSGRWTHSSSKN